jgi:hypothetical protein
LKCIWQNCLLLLNEITPPPTRATAENTNTIIPQMVASCDLLLSSIALMMTTIPEMSTIDEKKGRTALFS